jgi:hypothetical protein
VATNMCPHYNNCLNKKTNSLSLKIDMSVLHDL